MLLILFQKYLVPTIILFYTAQSVSHASFGLVLYGVYTMKQAWSKCIEYTRAWRVL